MMSYCMRQSAVRLCIPLSGENDAFCAGNIYAPERFGANWSWAPEVLASEQLSADTIWRCYSAHRRTESDRYFAVNSQVLFNTLGE